MNDDEVPWERCAAPLIPRKTVDGKWTSVLSGAVWRRRLDGKWQYRQDALTQEEYDSEQW